MQIKLHYGKVGVKSHIKFVSRISHNSGSHWRAPSLKEKRIRSIVVSVTSGLNMCNSHRDEKEGSYANSSLCSGRFLRNLHIHNDFDVRWC